MKIVTFGESLFRFSTLKGERLKNSSHLNFYLGGSELNIAANLSSLGIETSWVSALPDGMTGSLIQEKLKGLNVNLEFSETIPGGEAGWYLVEAGSTPRPDVVFNRSASSMARKKDFSFQWNKIFSSHGLFHTSGITAGLSSELTQEVKKAMTIAKENKVLISYDFNFRKNIWSLEESHRRQKDSHPLSGFSFCSESDLQLFFNKDPESKDYSSIFNQTSLKVIILSYRGKDESTYGVKAITPNDHYTSQEYLISNLDRIGVGDSMAAGFLYSYFKFNDLKKAADWAALAGALKYSINGDMALLKPGEIESILENGIKGIIR